MKLFLTITFLTLLSACSSKPYVVKQTTTGPSDEKTEVYVVGHARHTGFVIPTDDIAADLPQLKQRFGEVPYIEFGWGDAGFYQAREVNAWLTLKALFWPSKTVIHAVAVPTSPRSYFPNDDVRALCLDHQEYSRLKAFIVNSFYRDESGNIVIMEKGIYGDSQFYQGVGDYSMVYTCNKWTAKGLKSAGMEISTTFKLTADSVMNYLESYNQAMLGRGKQPDAICR